jgi:iron-sulfur cluster assembly protein
MDQSQPNVEQTPAEQPAAAAEKPAAPTSLRERAVPATPSDGIRLTPKAAEQVKAVLQKENYPDTMYLYVGVKGGGCSGLQYVLDLRDQEHVPASESDEVFVSEDIVIVCDLKSYIVGNLTGTEIDYRDGLMGAGFTFNNPNAKHTCGCGSSYSA